eukprot:gene11638-4879_t
MSLFKKSLEDLVKGIRASKDKEDDFIRTSIGEIKDEVKSKDMNVKVAALQKLTYLHMIGYDMSWASFHIVEVMSSPVFSHKRVGYLAASQCFNETTDVIIMTTQLIKKDLLSSNQYEAGVAISCLSNIVTPDLAKDLVSDVVTLVNSTRPYVRKKAVLVLFKIFLQYPDSLAPVFPRLKEKLSDSNPSVVANSVNVICELAKRNPKNYLSLAPSFFKLLNTLKNNWTLIKIVKLLGDLCPHEPRLAKKLVEPLTNLINTTPAKSLLYECLFTVTKGMHEQKGIVRLAVEKLKEMVIHPDQNLKYLGLLGLNNIMSVYPKIVSDMKEIIIECLDDEDITIRYRALDLICGVVSKKNMKGIIQKLLKICKNSDGQYRNVLIEKIIDTCSKNTYEFIPSFQWYITILMDLTQLKGLEKGELISNQLKNTVIRVKSIRAFAVEEMLQLINSKRIYQENLETSSLLYVINSAVWIIGEFVDEANNEPKEILKHILTSDIHSFPSWIQSSYIQTIMKIYASAAVSNSGSKSLMEDTKGSDSKGLSSFRDEIRNGIDDFLKSSDVEVQERSTTCAKILQLHEEFLENGIDIGSQIKSLFSEELNPVAPGSQKKVPVPEGLDLDSWINNENEFDDSDVEDEGSTWDEKPGKHGKSYQDPSSYSEAAKVFKLGKKKKTSKMDPTIPTHDVSELIGSTKKKKKKPKKGEKVEKEKKKKVKQEFVEEIVEISQGYDKPEGYTSPTEDVKGFYDDQLASVDLTKPTDVVLPTTKEYQKVTSEEILKKERQTKKEHVKSKKESSSTSTEEVVPTQTQTLDLLSFDDEPKKETKKTTTYVKEKRKKLCHDDVLKVSFSKPVPTNSHQIDVQLHIENTGNVDVSSIEYNVQTPMNMKVIRSDGKDSGNISTNLKLPKSHSGEITLNIGFKSIKKASSLSGALVYKTNKSNNLAFTLKMPVSLFFNQKNISTDKLSELIQNNKFTYTTSHSHKFPSKQNLDNITQEVATTLGISVVGNANSTTFLYGYSVQKQHLAVILKMKSDKECAIEVKSSDDVIPKEILSEIGHVFKRLEKK